MKKTALILGGFGGVGYACASTLAKNGYDLVVVHRGRRAKAEENMRKVHELEKYGVNVVEIKGNATTSECMEKVCNELRDARVNCFVHAIADGNIGNIFSGDRILNAALQGIDGSINRTITRGSRLELLVGNLKTDAGNTLHALTSCYLQVIQLDIVRSASVGTCQYQDIIISNLLLLVGKNQEFLINLVQTLTVNLHTIHAEAMLQGCTSATGCQHDCIIINTHILGRQENGLR